MIAGDIALYGIIIVILILYIKLGKQNIMKLKENIVFQIILIILFVISLSYLYYYTRGIPDYLAVKFSNGVHDIIVFIKEIMKVLIEPVYYSYDDVVGSGWEGRLIFGRLVWLCVIFIFIYYMYKYINDNNIKKRNHNYY